MKCKIICNRNVQGDYYEITFEAPEIAAGALPGQFVHVRIDDRNDRVLRRPFSIHNAANDQIALLYKVVGGGTASLAQKKPGECCDILGPLGVPFKTPDGMVPLLVAGGYGSAATYMLARDCQTPGGVLLLGARSQGDVVFADKYEKVGFDVRISTNDGSMGTQGFVTDLLAPLLAEFPDRKYFVHGCGPHPMLMALARRMHELQLPGELSIDNIMCCGVGACFGCVIKVNDAANPDGWRYARSCSEGPVFPLDAVYME